MADINIIQKFMQSLLDSGLVFKERDLVSTATLFKNYIEFLDGKIFYDTLKDMREKIISNCMFFPTIAEMLKYQKDGQEKIRKYAIICHKSLKAYVQKLPDEDYEKLLVKMAEQDKILNQEKG